MIGGLKKTGLSLLEAISWNLNNMKTRKFKIGDRVRLRSMTDENWYEYAEFKIGDTGTVSDVMYSMNVYCVVFDHLKDEKYKERYIWESDLAFENQVMKCE